MGSDWLLEFSPDSLIGAECEMRPLLVQHLQAVTGEGLLDSLLPHLLSTGYKDKINKYNKVIITTTR